jgi:16S rRNA (guanine527-N7)-methyltransferase
VEIKQLLKNGLLELGITPSDEQINAFMTYLSELKKWNKAYNLTGLKEDEEIITMHFLDSLLYLRAMPDETITLADIGTGAGFPGIPIKIIRPDIQMYLIEPSGKKAAFLRHIIRQIQLEQIAVIEKRIEEIKVNKELPCAVDIGVTRALFDISKFIKKASHIMRPGGILILNKGPKVHEEVARMGDVSYTLLTVDLPLSDIKRYIVRVAL